MIRNFSFDIFVISYMFGYFKKIPSWILLLIIIAAVLDAIALYFSGVDVSVYNKNPTLKKVIDIYLSYTKPQSIKKDPVWFFVDRLLVALLFLFFLIYFNYKHGFVK